MKKQLIIGLLLAMLPMVMTGQTIDSKYLDKVQTIDSTIETLYAVISGEKGEKRNWELFEYLFHPDAKLIPTQKNKEGLYNTTYMTPKGYQERAGTWLIENGFFEKELHKEVHTFGPITQVFSTYESFRSEADTKPFMRGINSIQMLYDGKRWWVINIYWVQESETNPIPNKYLPQN